VLGRNLLRHLLACFEVFTGVMRSVVVSRILEEDMGVAVP